MAKTEVARVNEETGEILDQPAGALPSLPDDLVDEISGLENMGYSEKSEDSMIPILAILQDNSAEVKKGHSKRIEGAEAGDLIIRSLGRVIKMGANLPPIVVQPAGFDHVWVEWNGEPGEGAPVAQYAFEDRPKEAEEVIDPQNAERKIWRMENGNRLQDTRYHYVNLLEDDGTVIPIVIPMGGTNHTASRQWTSQMKGFRMPGKTTRAPSFFRAYSVRTQFTQRGQQSWYKYAIGDMGWIREEATLRLGLDLLKAVIDNTVRAEVEPAEGDGEVIEDKKIPI